MDSIFFQRPVMLIFLAVIIVLHILSKLFKAPLILTVINGAVHVCALSAALLFGGNMEDALTLVLLSALAALLCCPKEKEDEE